MSSWYQDVAEDIEARKKGIDMKPIRYMRERIKGTDAMKAAKKAGYTGLAVRAPFKLIETPELKRQMQEAMIVKGLGLDSIAEAVANSLKANVIANLEDGPAESDVPDHKVRLKGVEQAAKLWGLADVQRSDTGGSTVTLTLAGPLADRFMQSMQPVVIEGE